ncbi:MAG: anti-sigma factor antagonist [Chloroflexi bacterium]|nr:anti-sigma factor antagonist [Chloroflexota bacterium]
MPEIFEASVRHVDGVSVIDLKGEMNAVAEQALTAAYHQASRDSSKSVLLNFRETTYINSTGIALIVAILAQARKMRQRVLVCGLGEHYRHIFQITRLADFMSLHDDEASAVAEATSAA